jgi:type VI secretion system Hcp family effector
MKFSSAILAAGIALFSPYLSAEEIFVTAVGLKQGPFAGEMTLKGFENKMQAVAFSHEVLADSTGRRQHKPVVITKRVGAASPQFFQAWASNEPLKSVTIDFTEALEMRSGVAGAGMASTAARRLVYQITLQNAVVVRIAQRLEPTTPVPAGGPAHLEEISLGYQSITVTFPPGNRTSSDSVTR